MNAKNELTRCRRKLTLLEKRGLTPGNGEYDYWAERHDHFEQVVFEEMIAELKAQHGPITLEHKIIANGARQITAYTNGRYVQHIDQKLIPTAVLEAIPTTADYRVNNPPCEVCEELGTEEHHWAPQHLFDDANDWPKSYLCKSCHDRWHKAILGHWGGNNHNGR